MKRLVIIKPKCEELGNHLINYLSIYAWGLEAGATVQNPSFYEWHHYFAFIKDESLMTRFFSFVSTKKGAGLSLNNKFWRIVYAVYARYISQAYAKCLHWSWILWFYLPPTLPPTKTAPSLENANICETLYLYGWLFRNPVGLEKHYKKLVAAFAPAAHIQERIQKILESLRKKPTVIGIHIRQKNFPLFDKGEFLVSPKRTRQILDEYLRENNLEKSDVSLAIVSDKAVAPNVFADFVAHISTEDAVTDLFLLSKCNVVLGDNSTFCSIAAWFGDVPHVVTQEEEMDWKYYQDKTGRFTNKYANFVQGATIKFQ